MEEGTLGEEDLEFLESMEEKLGQNKGRNNADVDDPFNQSDDGYEDADDREARLLLPLRYQVFHNLGMGTSRSKKTGRYTHVYKYDLSIKFP